MAIKGTFVSVVVTHEGEQRRSVPGVPPVPVVVTSPTLWVGCDSCHVLGFVLDASFTGNAYPRVVVEGSLTDMTEPITLNSNNSFLGQAVVDPGGNIYAINFYRDDIPGSTITYYTAGSQRNSVPARIISGSHTGLPARGSGILIGGLCVDTALNIWSLCGGTLLKFLAASNGNVTASQSTNISGDVGTINYNLFWDAARSLIWAVGNTASIAAYDTSGTRQRLITGGATGLATNVTGVAVDTAGLIYVTNNFSSLTSSVTVYAAAANGNTAPLQTISGISTSLNVPKGITVFNNTIYVGENGVGTGHAQGNFPPTSAFYTDCIFTWPTGTNGNVAPTVIVQGAKPEIDFMMDGTGSGPVSMMVGPTTTVPVPYHPPATRFTTASVTITGMSLPSSSRFGAFMCWSFGAIPFGATASIFQNTSGHGFTFNQNSSGFKVLKLFDASTGLIATATESSTFRVNLGNVWCQDLISWDTQAQTLQWYLGGVSSSNLAVTWSSANPVGYSGGDTWQYGRTTQDILVSDTWFNVPRSFFDLSLNAGSFSANHDLMSGVPYCYPVNIASGIGPTGLIFFSGNGTGFSVNQGTAGGSPVIAGTLSDGQNTP